MADNQAPNPLKFKDLVDSYLSGKAMGNELYELSRHPSWFVIPQILEGLLEKTRWELEHCLPKEVPMFQAHIGALRDIMYAMQNVIAMRDKAKALKKQGGIYGKNKVTPKK